MEWNNLVCLVTGASSGFGRETAIRLAARGARVIVAARRESRLKDLVEEIGGPPHEYVTCDVSDLDQVRELVRRVAELSGHLDILVNNAGVPTSGPFSQTTSEEMERVIRTNLLGAIWTAREALPLLEKAPRTSRTPVIVNVASMGGRLPLPKTADYIASKFGLVGFTESIWHDLKEKGIRAMAVEPGIADTEGFPMEDLRKSPFTSWTVMEPGRVADAIVRGIELGSNEVRVQWWLTPLYHATIWLGPLRRYVTGFLRKQFPTEL